MKQTMICSAMTLCAAVMLSTSAGAAMVQNNVAAQEPNSLAGRFIELENTNSNRSILHTAAEHNYNELRLGQSSTLSVDKLPVEQTVVEKLNMVASNTVRKFSQTGMASWYGRKFHGRKTASGERFNMNALTAAHRNLPLNCYIRVTNNSNGKSVVVKVNDRGPFHGNRVLDLSYGAAKRIGITNQGVAKVSIERVSGPK